MECDSDMHRHFFNVFATCLCWTAYIVFRQSLKDLTAKSASELMQCVSQTLYLAIVQTVLTAVLLPLWISSAISESSSTSRVPPSEDDRNTVSTSIFNAAQVCFTLAGIYLCLVRPVLRTIAMSDKNVSDGSHSKAGPSHVRPVKSIKQNHSRTPSNLPSCNTLTPAGVTCPFSCASSKDFSGAVVACDVVPGSLTFSPDALSQATSPDKQSSDHEHVHVDANT